MGTKKVVILQRISAAYRIPFYEQLASALKVRDIELAVVYGQHSKLEKAEDVPSFCYGRTIKNRYLYFGKRCIFWQPALRYLKGADLVIVQQATRNLIIYPLMLLRKVLGYKLAFWGHGRGFQVANPDSPSERLKRRYSVHVDHWFTYTDLSKRIIRDLDFPESRITSVNNAIDTNESIRISDEITQMEINELKRQYSIAKDSPVCIFCSRLYRDKRLDFLVRCVEKVKKQIPCFHVFVIGDGVDAKIVKNYADKNVQWFHYVGPSYGREKIKFFKLAQFQLMPGSVGLHIVESFASLRPLITTKIDTHGPEITYLQNGVNGIMTENTAEAYIRGIVRLIQDKPYHQRLVEGCRKAREQYTIENMVARFANGIKKALSEERKR